jgi:molybdopterin converting factor small subunit
MAIVTMRYWAAAKEAAGVAEETVTADTLAAALGRAAAGGGARLSSVLARSSFLIDGHPVGTRAADAVLLTDGAVIEVLPPFAGG